MKFVNVADNTRIDWLSGNTTLTIFRPKFFFCFLSLNLFPLIRSAHREIIRINDNLFYYNPLVFTFLLPKSLKSKVTWSSSIMTTRASQSPQSSCFYISLTQEFKIKSYLAIFHYDNQSITISPVFFYSFNTNTAYVQLILL